MKKLFTFYVLLLAAFAVGCKKEHDFTWPQVVTGQVTNITLTAAQLNGTVTLPGGQGVSDHGFIVSDNPSLAVTADTKKSLGLLAAPSAFSTTLTLVASQKYYVKAYAEIAGTLFFGEVISFSLLSPTISSFSPLVVNIGDTVTIVGNNFSANPTLNMVTILGVDLKPFAASETSMKVIIPEGMVAGKSKVKVSIGAGESVSDKELTVLPLLQSISPVKGPAATQVSITGKGFSSLATENIVKLDNIAVAVATATGNTLTFTVPGNITVGDYAVSVEVRGVKAEKKGNFRVPGWKKVSTAPVKRAGSFSFIIGNTLYMGGGIEVSPTLFVTHNDFWSYNFSTNVWTKLPDFPGGRVVDATAVSLHGRGYVCLGYDTERGASIVDFWMYNPDTYTWARMPDFPAGARSSAVSFTLNNKAYVGTGLANGITDLTDMYAFDPLSYQWSPVASYGGRPVYGLTSFTLGNKAYMVGGTVNGDQRMNECWEYDGLQDQWARKADFPGAARLEGEGFGFDNTGYFGLGSITNTEAGTDMWEYNPQTNTWKQHLPFPGEQRFGGVSGNIGNVGVFGMGYKGNTTFDDLWLYFP